MPQPRRPGPGGNAVAKGWWTTRQEDGSTVHYRLAVRDGRLAVSDVLINAPEGGEVLTDLL